MNILIFLEKIDRFFAKIFRRLIGLMLYAMMMLVFINVIFRYFINSPITWGEEVSVFLLMFIALFGAYVGIYECRMARITAIVNIVPIFWRKAFNLIAQFIIIYLLIFLVVYGFQFISTPYMLTQKTSTLRLPMWIFYSFVPISALLMLYHMILDVIRYLMTDKFSMDDESNVEEVN